jgi:hypothetical protein
MIGILDETSSSIVCISNANYIIAEEPFFCNRGGSAGSLKNEIEMRGQGETL